jgi:hypothetical protein
MFDFIGENGSRKYVLNLGINDESLIFVKKYSDIITIDIKLR